MADLRSGAQVLKQLNAWRIVEMFSTFQTATRVEIARHTGLSQPTVNAIIHDLLMEGSIVEAGLAISSGGRRAQSYTLNPNHACVAVLHAHKGYISYSVVNMTGGILSRGERRFSSPDKALDAVYALLDDQVDNSVKAIGIGVPGAVSRRGAIFAIPQLPAWEDLALHDLITRRYSLPVIVENDMNAMALGYYDQFPGGQMDDLAYIHIGAGIGAGVIAGGRIVKGFSSFAGEISYMYTGQTHPVTGQVGAPFETEFHRALDDDERARVIARLAVNVICILNPPVIAFSGSGVNGCILEDVRRFCGMSLPPSAIPAFQYVVDEIPFYVSGLAHIARDLLGTAALMAGGTYSGDS